MDLADKHITSEEKLLRLIRKKDQRPTDSRGLKEKKGADGGSGQAAQGEGHFWPSANRILLMLIIGLIAFSGWRYWQVTENIPVVPSIPEGEVSQEATVPSGPASTAKPFDAYGAQLSARDIFQAPWEKPATGTLGREDGSASSVPQLRLVGILLDADPKAIIEDSSTKQTFFAAPGDRVGQAVLQEIQEDRVILMLNNQRVELTL